MLEEQLETMYVPTKSFQICEIYQDIVGHFGTDFAVPILLEPNRDSHQI